MTITKSNISRGTVCHESWLQFLQAITRHNEGERLINGHKVRESHKRALFRWEKEGSSPVWWKVDEFLCTYNLIWTDFEIYCFVEKLDLWEKDPPENY